jgi:putative mycofactocin binding protein MftB
VPPVAGPSAPAEAATPLFDLGAAWRLHPRVALRAESFGALAYHFGTRRLSFLKSPRLRSLVESLADYPTAADACRAAGVSEGDRPAYARALATLAASNMIIPRATP